MKKITFYCDICGCDIEEGKSTRLILRNADLEIVYLDVCPHCIREIQQFIGDMQIKAGVEFAPVTKLI